MKSLAQAILGLGKAFLARPQKATQAPTQIPWTKVGNPLEEMTSEESKNFAEKMAENGMEHTSEYRFQYSSLQSALVTANGNCNGINLK